jgi:hypothetical protein
MAQSVKIIEKICQQKAENEHLTKHSHQKEEVWNEYYLRRLQNK